MGELVKFTQLTRETAPDCTGLTAQATWWTDTANAGIGRERSLADERPFMIFRHMLQQYPCIKTGRPPDRPQFMRGRFAALMAAPMDSWPWTSFLRYSAPVRAAGSTPADSKTRATWGPSAAAMATRSSLSRRAGGTPLG